MNANAWKQSSRCSSNGCIEIGQSAGMVHVRDSKDPDSPVLTFDPEAWAAFIYDVKVGGW